MGVNDRYAERSTIHDGGTSDVEECWGSHQTGPFAPSGYTITVACEPSTTGSPVSVYSGAPDASRACHVFTTNAADPGPMSATY